MKYILYILFPILYFSSQAQIQSSCTGIPLLAQTYDNDIADLALKRIYDIHSADTDLITIPQQYLDSVTSGLYAIYNTGSTIEADSIFRMYCIHISKPRRSIRDIEVFVDISDPWTSQWQNKQTTTGYIALDSFLSMYGYTLTDFFSISSMNVAYLHTDQSLNDKKIAKVLKTFHGIYDTESSYGAGDGSYITYRRDTVSYFDFYLSWGDCPSGCTSQKIWSYKVDNDCKVTFLGTQVYGHDAWPTPPNCNLFKVNVPSNPYQKTPVIYPNPVNEVLYITGCDGYSYSLFNIYGQRIRQGFIQEEARLNMGGLANGVYFVELKNATGNSIVNKVIKQ